MASVAASSAAARGSPARHFFLEVCRCLPFITRLHKLEEVVTLKELRAMVKAKFHDYKDVKDPRVTELLIFKAREELETYLMMHKQRHHAITEYLEPYSMRNSKIKEKTVHSEFLDSFYTTPYPQIARKA